MKVDIKILKQINGVQRVYLSEIEDARTSREVLDEVYRGRQAVCCYGERVFIRCGDDKDFFGVTAASDIILWIEKRLKKEN